MKLLIATPLFPPDIGGPATFAKIVSDDLPRKGVDSSVLSFGSVRTYPKGISHFIYFLKLCSWGRTRTLILALDPVSVGVPAFLASRLLGKKFVLRIAGDYAWEQGVQRFGITDTLDEFVAKSKKQFPLFVRTLHNIQFFVARNAELIIVPSVYLKKIVTAWGIAPEKIHVIYNSFDRPQNIPEHNDARRSLGLTGDIILSAGRLVPWKGFSTLINCMPKILEEHKGARLLIAGSGPLYGELTQKISSMHLEDHVTLLGDMSHDALVAYISAADCFTLNTGYEGFSHQILEVLSVGTPLVTTRVGGNPELVDDGETGTLIAYDDADALVGAVNAILNTPHVAHVHAERGKVVAEQFTRQKMVEATHALLTEIAKTQ